MCNSVIHFVLRHLDMKINSNRFGPLEIAADDVIFFPQGMLGMEDFHQWTLLAGVENEAVAWLQSVESPEVALAVVSPRRFVPSYQMRISRRELDSLDLNDIADAKVLAVAGKMDHSITLNLKAPLLINIERRLGRQVITCGDLPVRFKLGSVPPTLRRTA